MNRKFQSKRNSVIYSEDIQCVQKTFHKSDDYQHELKVYKEIVLKSWLKVPRVIGYDNCESSLYLEFVQGQLILDVLIALEVDDQRDSNYEQAKKQLINLVNWVRDFHQLFKKESYILGDVNYRNFILNKDQLIGFDFELVVVGDQEQEILELLSRYLIYSPIRSDFKLEVMKGVVKKLYEDKAEESLESIHMLADQRLEYRKNHGLDKK